MRVAAIQMCSGTDIGSNIEAAEALINRAADDGARLIATPEMTHCLQLSPKRLFQTITREQDDKGLAHFQTLAKRRGVYILIGSLAILAEDVSGETDKAFNRSFLIGPDGSLLARYDKIHLFDAAVSKAETYKESNVYDRGHRGAAAMVDDAKIGLSICYDVRFPALYSSYANAGASIITVPAAFTRLTGQAHWETLLRARAIETGCFIIAPAQGGEHADGRATWGRSMIVGPWGDIRAVRDNDTPGFISANIDLGDVEQARRKIPAWQHRPDYTVDGL